MKKVLIAVFLNMMFVFTLWSNVSARDGFYVGVAGAYNTVSGDFEGNSYLSGNNEIILIPEIENSTGYGIILGYGFNKKRAIEVSYFSSKHDAEWMGGSGDVEYRLLNIDTKFSFKVGQPAQPYLLIGLTFPTLIVKDGSYNSLSGEIGDGKYTGLGLNLGAGMDYYLNPTVSIGTGLTYHIISYNQAEGVSNDGSIDDPLSGSGLGLNLNAAYHF